MLELTIRSIAASIFCHYKFAFYVGWSIYLFCILVYHFCCGAFFNCLSDWVFLFMMEGAGFISAAFRCCVELACSSCWVIELAIGSIATSILRHHKFAFCIGWNIILFCVHVCNFCFFFFVHTHYCCIAGLRIGCHLLS